MADNVIHGTGKPRIIISTMTPIHTNTVKGVVGLVVELNTAVDLANLDLIYGLTNSIFRSLNSNGEETRGKIVSFSETAGDFITVESFSNSAPAVGAAITIGGYQLDFPYCQRLTEGWIPDFTFTKLYSGNIHSNKKGFYYVANMDYSGYINKTQLLLFRQLLRKTTTNIQFYPRSDNNSISYKVDLSPETEIILNQIQRHAGHRSFMISLVGLERLPEIPIYDGNPSGGYGDNYGLNYGTGL